MKLSTAINLGAHTIDELRSGSLYGCALGMACNSVGIDKSYNALAVKWPWLDERGRVSPCSHRHMDEQEMKFIIAHLFDSHIMRDVSWETDNEPWTLEQLVDYVSSIEPDEDAVETDDTETSQFMYSSIGVPK